jgi:thiamine-monophosphate kinase
MNEFELISRFFTRRSKSAFVENGDDCAVIAPSPGNAFAVTTDTLVEGRHFLSTLDPWKLGRRAVHVNLSDLAAMGALPRYALLSLTLPSIDELWVSRFAAGLWSALDEFSVELVGGNTTRGPLAIAITAFGDVAPGQALLRSGAERGDELWVSGPLGDAGWALYCMLGDIKGEASAAQIARYECPTARVALGASLRGVATSCIDISDGLLSEAQHIANASNVHIEIEFNAIPTELGEALSSADFGLRAQHCVLATGDAYELLFTAPVSQHNHIEALFQRLSLGGACIGRVVAAVASDSANVTHAANSKANVRVFDAQSRIVNVTKQGWDHFAHD